MRAVATLFAFLSAFVCQLSLMAQVQLTADRFQMHRGVDRQEVIERTLNVYVGEQADIHPCVVRDKPDADGETPECPICGMPPSIVLGLTRAVIARRTSWQTSATMMPGREPHCNPNGARTSSKTSCVSSD